jgi:hypothetical protein
VRVAQLRGNLDFSQEALDAEGRREAGFQDLDGDLSPVPQVFG